MAASRLRVTGGVARGTPLVAPRGLRLRPTSARLREVIFNVLGAHVVGASVLDLYAGTGALGIEALSRGATHATFIDVDAAAVNAIVASLSRIRLGGRAAVLRARLPAALATLRDQFDIILLDPPYTLDRSEEIETLLAALDGLIRESSLVVYEHASRYNPSERIGPLSLADRRVYGDNAVAFFTIQEGE